MENYYNVLWHRQFMDMLKSKISNPLQVYPSQQFTPHPQNLQPFPALPY